MRDILIYEGQLEINDCISILELIFPVVLYYSLVLYYLGIRLQKKQTDSSIPEGLGLSFLERCDETPKGNEIQDNIHMKHPGMSDR